MMNCNIMSIMIIQKPSTKALLYFSEAIYNFSEIKNVKKILYLGLTVTDLVNMWL